MKRAVVYDPDLVRSVNLPEKIEAFLLKEGLPLIEPADAAVLGVRFQSFTDMGLLYDGEHKLLPIGYEWEPESSILGLAQGSGHLYSFHPASGQTGFVNSDIHLFLLFLSCVRSFIASHSEGDQPTIWTAEEMRERLAAFQRGEIVPKRPNRPVFDRKAELTRMRAMFEEKDAASLADENHWWSCVLEQLEDGLL
ncbi:SUKH-4 family immunity protein [Paenibacillus chitinolyticus]|uniref:SUKH-4 family immunity protein n=1 Tax=Paenibacillus chitinolyticus TaxID=79263 RepID=UPI00366C080C